MKNNERKGAKLNIYSFTAITNMHRKANIWPKITINNNKNINIILYFV